MTSRADHEQAEQSLLSLATEDWYSLAEGASAVYKLSPEGAIDVRPVVAAAIRSLLARGLIRLARLNVATNEEVPIPEARLSAVLENNKSWDPPSGQDPWAVSFTATQLGEQQYFAGPAERNNAR